jgi:hypothetical protein
LIFLSLLGRLLEDVAAAARASATKVMQRTRRAAGPVPK